MFVSEVGNLKNYFFSHFLVAFDAFLGHLRVDPPQPLLSHFWVTVIGLAFWDRWAGFCTRS